MRSVLEPAIRVEGVDVWYAGREGRFQAVSAASFAVAAGSVFGLVGGSGSGKSTLLRTMAGLWRGFGGVLDVGGHRLEPGRRPPMAFHASTQMVFQDPFASLNPRHTVDRALGDAMTLHGFADLDARVPRLLDQVGLGGGFRFRYPHELSGGQRQRVAIARALAVEPSILLLDEPTSALDASVQAEILNLLAAIRRDRGLTMVLVTHDLGVVAHMSDRIAVMSKGRIVRDFAVDEWQATAGSHQNDLAALISGSSGAIP
jgi:peptide/nickel transport system ATP-binding protein